MSEVTLCQGPWKIEILILWVLVHPYTPPQIPRKLLAIHVGFYHLKKKNLLQQDCCSFPARHFLGLWNISLTCSIFSYPVLHRYLVYSLWRLYWYTNIQLHELKWKVHQLIFSFKRNMWLCPWAQEIRQIWFLMILCRWKPRVQYENKMREYH